QAFEDADTLIVQTAIEHSDIYDNVEIVGEDVDLLVLLTGLAQGKENIFFHKPAKGKVPAVFICNGCDTTSALFNVGRKKFMTVLRKNPQLKSAAQLFRAKDIDTEVLVAAGERFLIAVYGGEKQETSLSSLRYKRFAKSVTKSTFNLSTLPPPTTAAREHILRTYLQVQTWMGNYKEPEEYGWRKTKQGLEPVINNAQAVLQELLKIIACKCKRKSGGACGCRKAGLKCSMICKNCDGETCDNVVFDDDVDYDDSDDDVSPTLTYVAEEDNVNIMIDDVINDDDNVNIEPTDPSTIDKEPSPKRLKVHEC
ncbi:hypothetical protein ALC57_10109, partial [Trachymyrmex cornetzi]